MERSFIVLRMNCEDLHGEYGESYADLVSEGIPNPYSRQWAIHIVERYGMDLDGDKTIRVFTE